MKVLVLLAIMGLASVGLAHPPKSKHHHHWHHHFKHKEHVHIGPIFYKPHCIYREKPIIYVPRERNVDRSYLSITLRYEYVD